MVISQNELKLLSSVEKRIISIYKMQLTFAKILYTISMEDNGFGLLTHFFPEIVSGSFIKILILPKISLLCDLNKIMITIATRSNITRK